ncbi:MAG: acyl-CoA thioesterase [Actinomycetota bacterium]|nr:acyl-CoA thioesterase [Actinomycetota bacterium]
MTPSTGAVAAWCAPVRYVECDQQGIVFNGHYLTYADEASTAWFGQVGTPYGALLERGLDLRVKAAALEWSGPARWGDEVSVGVTCERVGGTSFTLRMDVRVGARPCCTVRTTYVLVDPDGRPVRVPDDLRATWTGS